MDARTYIAKRDGKLSRYGNCMILLAETCEVSPYYLYMVVAGHKPFTPLLATRFHVATGGECSRRELCPEFPWDEPATVASADRRPQAGAA